MQRLYTRDQYLERIAWMRSARREIAITTDVIVGFPGETEDDFAQTLSLVREVGFIALFGFKYSPRPLTPALRLPDDVPEEIKSERLARLFEVVEELGAAHLATLVGTRQRVLVEGASKSEKGDLSRDRVQGRTEGHAIVHVEAPGAGGLVGTIVEVEVVRANKHSLTGVPTGPLPPPAPRRPERRALPVVAAG
jgi:tRNA-2-methylthio-N6-dimethylallyladenosine synthase